jgi:hypothetical protein
MPLCCDLRLLTKVVVLKMLLGPHLLYVVALLQLDGMPQPAETAPD